jgi:hypothetical protein
MRQILWGMMTLLAVVWLASPCGAAPKLQSLRHSKSRIDITYELRFWFIPFGHTDYHVTYDGSTYQATSHFNTSGLISVFWQAQINAGVSGWLRPHKISPYIYDSYAQRPDGKFQQVKLSFQTTGPPRLFANPSYNTKRYPVSIKEQETGIDPMSAISFILTGMSATSRQPCGQIVRVFDGRRRYDVVFTFLHDDRTRHSQLQRVGPAYVCALQYRQIAGFKPNLLRGKNLWPRIYARVVDITTPSAPLGRYIIPVKLWSDTDWGRVSAHLTSLRINGRTMVHG